MWQSLAMAFVLTVAMSLAFYVWVSELLLMFTTDAEVIAQGAAMLRFLTPFWVTYISIDNIPPKELATKLEDLLDEESHGEIDLE